VPLVSVHGAQHLLAVAAHQESIRLGLHPSRQRRRIHQIGEEDRQPPDLTRIARRGQQVLGLGVRIVSSQHLSRQGRRDSTITAVDRRHRAIQQLINRRPTLRAGFTVSRRAHSTVAHLDIVAPLARHGVRYRSGTTDGTQRTQLQPAAPAAIAVEFGLTQSPLNVANRDNFRNSYMSSISRRLPVLFGPGRPALFP
jgi:hypothetical protein